MDSILILVVILIGVALTAVILVQQSKGSDIGASFGSGASNTVFGAKGATSFFFKLTAALAIAFTVAIVLLVKVTNNSSLEDSVITSVPAQAASEEAPAIPVLSNDNSSQDTATDNNNQ